MKPLHPLLQRAFTLARPPSSAEPPPYLEDRLIAHWKAATPESAPPYRSVLACACGCLAVSAWLAYHSLSALPDPAVAVANAAIRTLLPL